MIDKPSLNETPEEREHRLESASRAHDQRNKAQEVHAKAVETYSVMAMRAPALVSAAGVVALLGFYSANYARLSTRPESLVSLNSTLFYLFLTLLLTTIAPGLAYFSQFAYAASTNAETHHLVSPFVRDTTRTVIYERVGDAFRIAAIVCTLASILVLGYAGYGFLSLVR